MNNESVYFDLDGAWGQSPLDLSRLDGANWGPRLRYVCRHSDIDACWSAIGAQLGKYVLYGSGDFHHLAGMLIRRVQARPFILVSFDNHPDWDIKPPYWACGGWAARTLYTGQVSRVSVWGCGNFELQWPSRLFADWKAIKAGKLDVHAWAERQKPREQKMFNCMTRQNWSERFEKFAQEIAGQNVYVTVDIDCLREEEAATNWENGLFTADDIAWALRTLRKSATMIGGDLCGAVSSQQYERRFQRFAGAWDHPKIATVAPTESLARNMASLTKIWPALIGQ